MVEISGPIAYSHRDVRHRLHQPVVTAAGTVDDRRGIEITATRDGHRGLGEALPLPGWSTITLEEARAQVAAVASGDLSVAHAHTEVQAAVDGAHWWLRAAEASTALRFLLSPSASDRVRVNAIIDGRSSLELRHAVRTAQRDGYRTIKVKLGFEDDRERIEAVADELDDDVTVRLDPNGAWDASRAAAVCGLAAGRFGSRLEYVEDPVVSVELLRACRSTLPVPVALDRLAASHNWATPVPPDWSELAVAVVVKPALIGGVDPTVAAAAALRSAGLTCVLTSVYDGPVGLRTWLHLAAAVEPRTTHGLGTAILVDDDAMRELAPVAGEVHL